MLSINIEYWFLNRILDASSENVFRFLRGNNWENDISYTQKFCFALRRLRKVLNFVQNGLKTLINVYLYYLKLILKNRAVLWKRKIRFLRSSYYFLYLRSSFYLNIKIYFLSPSESTPVLQKHEPYFNTITAIWKFWDFDDSRFEGLAVHYCMSTEHKILYKKVPLLATKFFFHFHHLLLAQSYLLAHSQAWYWFNINRY